MEDEIVKKTWLGWAIGIVFAMGISGAFAATTLENLQAAYNGESNAKIRYEAFAVKADAEGYRGVASLFRAAAQAEGIHQANHAGAIEAMGGKPTNDIKAPEVKTTKENLAAALAGENHERLSMYPEFIRQAEGENNRKAVRTFKFALEAESMHAKYFEEASKNLDAWKGAKTFLVCSNCGYTTADGSIKKCPVCSYPRKKINEVK
jgi:rubrerythrin